jgi:hypothetical protein
VNAVPVYPVRQGFLDDLFEIGCILFLFSMALPPLVCGGFFVLGLVLSLLMPN